MIIRGDRVIANVIRTRKLALRTFYSILLSCSALLSNAASPAEFETEDQLVSEIVRGFQEASAADTDVRHVVQNALNSKRAVVFVHVDWGMTHIWHTRFAEFLVQYQKRNPNGRLHFHYADCTAVSSDYAPLREIPGWMKLVDEAGTAMIHANGEIAWIENGRVLHVQRISDFRNASRLVAFTMELMPGDG
ncbi:hypothetical protein FYK55_17175 [Roseiconus nitratireducens]|uniref:Uncharacterized protein n=1 Tax=Roseiconus nitratireducens TaxID=2605748 RepID=A0A5M6D330_9BACT|nr:hypothetical protein [Roseiconus nitratireducens]KAA5541927.1 hypothetical protein FYK55_17175 [Roseiconus nitratireducens]